MKQTLVRRLSIILIFILLTEPFGSRILNQQEISLQNNSQKTNQSKSNSSKLIPNISSPQDRELRQKMPKFEPIEVEFRPVKSNWIMTKSNTPDNHYFLPTDIIKGKHNKKLRNLQKKEDLMMLASSIKKEAKKHNLKIKRVYLGNKVKKRMHNMKLEKDLSSLLSTKSLKSRMRKLRQKIKKSSKKLYKRKKSSFSLDKNLQFSDAALEINRNLMSSSSSSSSSKKKGDDEMAFNFMPGYAGMPFPPFMMNGPHFHPPLNVTVNALPNPNPRSQDHPSALQEENLQEDQNELEPILDKLNSIKQELGETASDTNVDLQGKYQQVLNGFM